jgi:hypothetical protein
MSFAGSGESAPLLPDDTDLSKSIDLRVSNYSLPNQVTTYACESFDVPSGQDMIAIEPLINEENTLHVHHMLVFACFSNAYSFYKEKPDECPRTVLGDPNCPVLLFAWAQGKQLIVLVWVFVSFVFVTLIEYFVVFVVEIVVKKSL